MRNITTIRSMLQHKRPANTNGEVTWIERWIDPLGCDKDAYGNRYIIIGNQPTTIYSSHTDTVHHNEGRIKLKIKSGIISCKKSSCLGADDGAGVYIMREMIKKGVKGIYIFHREEECGMGGSAYMVKTSPPFMANVNKVVAFDRKGTQDIINRQGGRRTASDTFCTSLASMIGMGHVPCTGVFTDSESYADDIPECTNLSVGYEHAHSSNEYLDTDYLFELTRRMIKIGNDIDGIPPERDHTIVDTSYGKWWDDQYHYGSYSNSYDRVFGKGLHDKPTAKKDRSQWTIGRDSEDALSNDYEDMLVMVKDYPELAASLLIDEGITRDDFQSYVI